MNNSLFLKKILPLIFLILICASLIQTYGLMKNHFTHGDDIGVAYTFLKEDFFNKACEKNVVKKEAEILFKALGSNKDRFCNLYYYPYIYTVIPRSWTYAPLQFWFTQALLRPDNYYSYEKVKLLGRLPSFAFHTLGLLLFFLLLKKKIFSLKNELVIPLTLTLVAAFSLEQRIMASQMESYAIGLLSNCFALYAVLELRKLATLLKKQLFGLGLILALAVAMQYQALFLVFSGLITVFILNLNNRPIWIWLKKFILLNLYFVLCLGLTVAILFLRHLSGGINWNAGPNGEFIVGATTISGKFLKFGSLLLNSSGYNFYSVMSAIEIDSFFYANSLGLTFLFLFILGFVFLFLNRKVPQNRFLFSIISVYISLYLLFILLGRFSYAPTRHFLFFLPIILIIIGHGLLLIRPIKHSIIFDYVLGGVIVVYAIFSLKLFPLFEQKRIDTSQNFNIPMLYFESGAELILLDQFDMEPFFMPELQKQPIYRYRPKPLCRDFPPLSNPNHSAPMNILWYSKRVILDANGSPTALAPYEGGAIKDYFIKVLEDCHPNKNIRSDDVKVKKISDVLIHRSSTEIDLSNLTKNGANELFLQTFKVEFQGK
ncbi:MAG: hypothetical protein K9J35_07125 [Rhodoferax sp.]|nr:hypothetical protein [Rhodoferax sp.]